MPTKRMLIDASHPEETRVVVVDGTRLEEYDVEVANRRQLKGNIYLAKITRVEPSLQAAFVEYGGNRHGFLAFNEIHPDYYQIPVADRERLLAEEAALQAAAAPEPEEHGEEGEIQEVGGDDDDEIERRPIRFSRHYKIQEVIKRRQIMLVQVAKEERGNKGAALTTFLSLAGRYCVLMPNTARGGGISRKIANVTDRKRLKKILSELDVPEGMAVIVRTAGEGRSKPEIKRDYDYMMRLWSNIRENTLQSMAPALVYEEGNLIKRSLRDLYERDVEEIIIQGEPEYKVAREFMKLFIPSHAKRVKLFEDTQKPLFPAYSVEEQLDAMHQPVVQLRSGGYIVITSTEALVSIDVNSGRATRERHIEETALRTNLEAADEVARQLRLRDLAGLIVIDFIDMENARNQAMVERRMKEGMKGDRARTQIGRISAFGLLELSRQRLRPSLLETSFEQCPHCRGMGVRRTTESAALLVLRKIEEEGLKQKAAEIIVTTPPAVAMYLLNQKRRTLGTIESRFGFSISIAADAALMLPDYRIDRSKLPFVARGEEDVAPADVVVEAVADADEADETAAETAVETAAERGEDGGKRGRRRRGRRRGKRGDEDVLLADADADADPANVADEGDAEAGAEAGGQPADDDGAVDDGAVDDDAEAAGAEAGWDRPAGDDAQDKAARKRRRRGKRGGRRRGRRAPGDEGVGGGAAEGAFEAVADGDDDGEGDADAAAAVVGGADDGEALTDDGAAMPASASAIAAASGAAAEDAEVDVDADAGAAPAAGDGAAAAAADAGDGTEAETPAPKPARRRSPRASSGRTPRRRTKAAAAEEPAAEAAAEEPQAESAAEEPATQPGDGGAADGEAAMERAAFAAAAEDGGAPLPEPLDWAVAERAPGPEADAEPETANAAAEPEQEFERPAEPAPGQDPDVVGERPEEPAPEPATEPEPEPEPEPVAALAAADDDRADEPEPDAPRDGDPAADEEAGGESRRGWWNRL